LFTFASCSKISDNLDVVGKNSKTSFAKILETIPDNVEADDANGGWWLDAPDGTARFFWSADYSQDDTNDLEIDFDAKPFIAAGLNPDFVFPDTISYKSTAADGEESATISIGTNLGDEKPSYDGDDTPLSAYEQIVNLYRNNIGYHEAMDHYGISLGDGNMLEWAKDMSKNDKDLVYVLNPEPFIDAGVDPESIDGWTYAKVPMMDENGKNIEVYKLLKPFDLD
jgi:hypothetical protein